jgi:hypothetical protein
MCCWAHVVSQERLEFRSHMAQESGHEKKDSAVHILSLFSSFTLHSLLYYSFNVRVFLEQKNYGSFLSQPCFCSVFWGHSRERVSVKSMISPHREGSKLHFETPNPRGRGALVYCCNNFVCDGAKSK